jgi:RNA polymerase sigma-70 factor (ECF subfamily)
LPAPGQQLVDAARRVIGDDLRRGCATGRRSTGTPRATARRAARAADGGKQYSTWLYRIAANVASDWLRSRPAKQARVTVELSNRDDGEADHTEAEASPEQKLIRKEMGECIRGVIGELPEKQRTALMLAELAGYADDDIARVLGISIGNAKVRLHRARASLKQLLEKRCDFSRNEENEFVCEPKPAVSCDSGKGTSYPDRCRSSTRVRDANL